MPKSHKIVFSSFHLLEVSAKDFQSSQKAKGNSGSLVLAPEVEFGRNLKETRAPFHVRVIVRLKATLSGDNKEKDNPPSSIEALIAGQGRFEIMDISCHNFENLFNSPEFLDNLADRVYPLVQTRLTRLLNEMGVGIGQIPLSLPEVENREVSEYKPEVLPKKSNVNKLSTS